jgi:cell division protein FtsB
MNYLLSLNQPIIIIFKKRKFLNVFWTLNLILFLTFFILSFFQIGVLIKNIYLISEYEKKIEKLSKENKNLEIELSKLNSLTNIENYLINENFSKVGPNQMKYFQILEDTIVSK